MQNTIYIQVFYGISIKTNKRIRGCLVLEKLDNTPTKYFLLPIDTKEQNIDKTLYAVIPNTLELATMLEENINKI